VCYCLLSGNGQICFILLFNAGHRNRGWMNECERETKNIA
jgi:hypothetical protein